MQQSESNTTKISLEDLPDDLILAILDQTADAGCKADQGSSSRATKGCLETFRNLTLTSRRLRRVVTPYLYNIIDCDSICPINLLRTATKHADLAANVKRIRWGYKSEEKIPPRQPYRFSHDERQVLRQGLSSFDIYPQRQSYDRSFDPQYSRDYLAALLLLTPNVQSLDICEKSDFMFSSSWYREDRLPLWIRILCAAALRKNQPSQATQSFNKLSRIRISMGNLSLSHISPIFQLPSLRVLQLKEVYQPSPLPLSHWNCPSRSSLIEELSFKTSFIDTKAVAEVLSSIKSLRTFEHDFSSVICEKRHWTYLGFEQVARPHYPTLVAALRQHKDSVKKLRLHIDTDLLFAHTFEYDKDRFSSLRDFSKISHLNVDLAHITMTEFDSVHSAASLPDQLPANIQHLDLHLRGDNSETWISALEDLASQCRSKVPQLRKVRARCFEWPVKRTSDEGRRLIDAFERQNVRLEIETVDLDAGLEVDKDYDGILCTWMF